MSCLRIFNMVKGNSSHFFAYLNRIALKKNNGLLKRVLDLSPVGTMAFASVRDDQGEIVDFEWTLSNKTACEMVAIKESDLIGQRLLDLMPGNKKEGLFDAYVGVVETGKPWEKVHYYHHEAIHKIWFRTNAQKEGDGFVVTFQDISKEMNLLEKTELAFEGTRAGMWDWVDVEKDEEIWTDQFYRMLGYQPGEIEASLKTFSAMLHPEDRETTFAAVNRHFEHGEPFELPYRLKTKDDGYRWFLGSGKAQFDKTGKAVRMVGSIIDINRQKILETDQQLLIDQLTIRNSQLGEFGHIVSHNIRGPVGNLRVLLSLFKEANDKADQSMILEKMESVSKALSGLLEDLVETVKVLEKENVRSSKLKVSDSLERAQELLDAQIEETKANIQIDLEWDEIEYYKLYLDSVLLNLMSNALKYSDPNRPLAIKISTSTADHSLTFEDNGLGIDLKRHGNKIFGLRKRFHKNVEGKGLGLFITKNQIQSMGGSITVDSALGEGTKFTISFKTTEAR